MVKVVNVVKQKGRIVAYDLVDENEIPYTVSKAVLEGYVSKDEVINATSYKRKGRTVILLAGDYDKREGTPLDTDISFDKKYYSKEGLMIACTDLPKYLRQGFVEADDPIFIKVLDNYRAVGIVRDYVDAMLKYFVFRYIKRVPLWDISNCFGSGKLTAIRFQKILPKKYTIEGDIKAVEAFIKASSYSLVTDNCFEEAYLDLDRLVECIAKERGVSIYSLRNNGFAPYYAISLNPSLLLCTFSELYFKAALIDPDDKLIYSGFFKNPERKVTGDIDMDIIINLDNLAMYNHVIGFEETVFKHDFPYKSVKIDEECTATLKDLSKELQEPVESAGVYMKFLSNKFGAPKEFHWVYEFFNLQLGGVEKDDITIG